jgi:NAD(P)-dependent dehydrogenase (short-subunit alcohol dehydrogenase family)
MPLTGVYTSSKFAVEGLSDAMRIELAPMGIQVVLVEPGPINTSFNATLSSTSEQMPSNSPWTTIYDASDELIASFEAGAPGPAPVSRAIARAAESRWPRARYVAPGYLAPVLSFVARLPAFVVDTFCHYAFGFGQTRRGMAAQQVTA